MGIIRNVHSSRSQDPRLSGQNGLCHMSSGCDLSLRTLHYIVVMARVWRRREMIFLCEELIAEGFPGGARVRQNYYSGCFFVNRTLNIVLIAAMPAKKITSAELSPRETFPTRNRM